MADERQPGTEELAARIDRDWGRLAGLASGASPAALVAPGPDRWTPLDHLAHVAAWGEGLVGFAQGTPLHDALGVPADTYDEGGIDAVNAILFERGRQVPPAEALDRFAATRDRVRQAVLALGDAGLAEERASGPGGPAFPLREWVDMFAGGHAGEHLAAVAELLAGEVRGRQQE